MAKTYTKIIIYTALAIVIAALTFIGACVVRAKKYERGYAQVGVGESKQKVVALLGDPSEIENCHYFIHSGVNERDKERCVEMYWYRSFLEDWVFVFDKDGKVISKFYNISG